MLGRFPSSRVLRRIAAERAAVAGDVTALAQLAAVVCESDRDEAAALRLLGEQAFADGDAATALGLLTASTQADPLEAETWSDLAVVRHEQGRRAAALEALEIALAISPDHEDALANRAAIRGGAATPS